MTITVEQLAPVAAAIVTAALTWFATSSQVESSTETSERVMCAQAIVATVEWCNDQRGETP